MTSGLRTLLLIGGGAGVALAILGVAVFQITGGLQAEPVVDITRQAGDGTMRFVMYKDNTFLYVDPEGAQAKGTVDLQTATRFQNELANAELSVIEDRLGVGTCSGLPGEAKATYIFYQVEEEKVFEFCGAPEGYGFDLLVAATRVQQNILQTVLQRQQQ